ncbi:TLC domain-containing protein [Citrus sinensis]|uniref:TLC domain-containing protein n=1 Tax=Citrus sinensis TaxID=2711 RepID=A0ACB8KRH3_CITSI|nr:TLC domain-containing protein [Citrus sinensis]
MRRATNYAILRFMAWRFILDNHWYSDTGRHGLGRVKSLQINNPKRLAGDKSKSIDARPLLFPINCQLPSNETKRKKKLPLSSIGDCYLSLSLKSDSMARTSTKQSDKNKVGVFFLATLLLWSVSVLFEIAFNKRKELLFIVAGACFFQIANWVIRLLVSRDPLFVNTSVSLLHSTITSVSVVFIVVNQWLRNGLNGMFEHSELVGSAWLWAYPALCFSCGYFAYDQWDMLQYRLYSGLIPGILVHHLLLLVCFTLALYRNVTINYLILTLICEVRRMAGIRDSKSRIVRVEWVLNWITFFLARIASHLLITIKLIRDASKFEKGIELPLALFGMAGMNLLNVSLGIDLFNAFKREKNPQQTSYHRRK